MRLARHLVWLVFTGLAACSYPLSPELREQDLLYITERLSKPEQVTEYLAEWPSTRRHYQLLQLLEQIGVERCDRLTGKKCPVGGKHVVDLTRSYRKTDKYRLKNDKSTGWLFKIIQVLIGEGAPESVFGFFYAPEKLVSAPRLASFLEVAHHHFETCGKLRPSRWLFFEGGLAPNYYFRNFLPFVSPVVANGEKGFIFVYEANDWRRLSFDFGVSPEGLPTAVERSRQWFCR